MRRIGQWDNYNVFGGSVIVTREYIKNRSGKILGFIDTDSEGNRTARTKEGRVLGYYKKKRNVTTNVGGKILSYGDTVSSMIPQK